MKILIVFISFSSFLSYFSPLPRLTYICRALTVISPPGATQLCHKKKTNWRKETNWDSGSCTKRGLHLLNAFTVVQGWADFSILRRSSSCLCKMEFIPRVKQIRWSQNVGREPVYSGEDNPDITSPPPRPMFTQVFQPRSWKAAGIIKPSAIPGQILVWIPVQSTASQPAATDLCLSKAGPGWGDRGQIWLKYGDGRWSIHFPATDTGL